MALGTLRLDETYRDAFGPVCSSAPSKRILFVTTILALTCWATVVDVLALVKHWRLEEVVTRPWTVRLEFARIRWVVERELSTYIVLRRLTEPPTDRLFWTVTGPTVDTVERMEMAWLTERLDWTK